MAKQIPISKKRKTSRKSIPEQKFTDISVRVDSKENIFNPRLCLPGKNKTPKRKPV